MSDLDSFIAGLAKTELHPHIERSPEPEPSHLAALDAYVAVA